MKKPIKKNRFMDIKLIWQMNKNIILEIQLMSFFFFFNKTNLIMMAFDKSVYLATMEMKLYSQKHQLLKQKINLRARKGFFTPQLVVLFFFFFFL